MNEFVSIADAAAECGVTVERFISDLTDAGLLLVVPGTEDARCRRLHVEDCSCRFVASPHPDVADLR